MSPFVKQKAWKSIRVDRGTSYSGIWCREKAASFASCLLCHHNSYHHLHKMLQQESIQACLFQPLKSWMWYAAWERISPLHQSTGQTNCSIPCSWHYSAAFVFCWCMCCFMIITLVSCPKHPFLLGPTKQGVSRHHRNVVCTSPPLKDACTWPVCSIYKARVHGWGSPKSSSILCWCYMILNILPLRNVYKGRSKSD